MVIIYDPSKHSKDLYFTLYHNDLPAMLKSRMKPEDILQAQEWYEFGPRSNYGEVKRSTLVGIPVNPDGIHFYLEDVLINGEKVPLGNWSSYEFLWDGGTTEENGREKITAALGKQIDLGHNEGIDYSGSRIVGYLKGINQGQYKEVKLPDFDF